MKVDMSPHAITMRIKKVSELRRLCLALGGDRLRKKMQSPQFRRRKTPITSSGSNRK